LAYYAKRLTIELFQSQYDRQQDELMACLLAETVQTAGLDTGSALATQVNLGAARLRFKSLVHLTMTNKKGGSPDHH